MRDEGGFAYSFRAENQHMLALRVQSLKQRDFPGTINKWQRDIHRIHGTHRFVMSQNTSSITHHAGMPQFEKA